MEYKRQTSKKTVSRVDGQYEINILKGIYSIQNDMDGKGDYCEGEIVDRLAELEDKIANSTLVELPCKVGDVMYEVVEGIPIQEWEIESICFNRTYPKGVIWAERTRDLAHWKFWIEDCGTKWFVTKTEAEKALEEIKNGK